MTLHLWHGPIDHTLPWRTTANTDYDDLLDDLTDNWSAFRGIHVRRLPDRNLQFYSYVVQELPPDINPDDIRVMSEGDIRLMKTGLREP